MPDRDLEIALTGLLVQWGPTRLAGAGVLRLTSEAIVVEPAIGDTWQVRYAALTGGGWRSGAVTVYGEPGSASFEAQQGLDQAWAVIVSNACPLPELTRTHRLLGSSRGGSVAQQARFLAPLLQARKRLEEVADLDTRVAALDARALRERMIAAIQEIAKDIHGSSDPDRRAMEAELEDAMAPVFGGLDVLHSAAQVFRNAAEATRFAAWREWVATLMRVFTLADSGWARVSHLIPSQRP